MFVSVPTNNEDGTPKSQEQIDAEMEIRKEAARKNHEEFMARMTEESLDECGNCGVDITHLSIPQVNQMMRYIPRVHCAKCHNKSILGIDEFYSEHEFDGKVFSRQPVGKGWMPIVTELNEKLIELYPDYLIVQVKEKFGELRYYTDNLPLYTEEARNRAKERIEASKEKREPEPWALIQSETRDEDYTDAHKLISAAESKAAVTCEECGQPGELSCNKEGHAGWIRTECADCMEANERTSLELRRQEAEKQQTENDPED